MEQRKENPAPGGAGSGAKGYGKKGNASPRYSTSARARQLNHEFHEPLTGMPNVSLDQRRERLLQQLRRDAAWLRYLTNEVDCIGLFLRDSMVPVAEAEAWHAEVMGVDDTSSDEEVL